MTAREGNLGNCYPEKTNVDRGERSRDFQNNNILGDKNQEIHQGNKIKNAINRKTSKYHEHGKSENSLDKG